MLGTRIYSGAPWEEAVGYARAVVLPDPNGDWILVSGTTGYDYQTGAISPDPAEQARQCFRTIARALEQAGAGLEDLVRIRIIAASREAFDAVTPIIGENCRAARPAATAIVAQLIAPEMLVEIEVTARKTPR